MEPSSTTATTDPKTARLIREADRCVKCGLCLPACPTYRVSANEAESPRGRVALIDGLARGRLERSAELDDHLDNCLLCRHCEAVCPAGVRFGALMDDARALQVPDRGRRAEGYLVDTLARPGLTRALVAGQRLFGWLPDRIGGRRLRAQGRAAAELAGAAPAPGIYPVDGTCRGRVGLFLGCVGRTLQARALTAAVSVLQRCGYEVEIPRTQVCCGAMHAHAGYARRAATLAAANVAAFGNLDTVVSLASGCGAHLVSSPDYGEAGFEHLDLGSFLRRHQCLERVGLRPLPGRAAVHHPCTERNVLRAAPATDLLGRIPQLEVVELPGNALCCGAAGMHLLTHGPLAERLRLPKLDALRELRPDWLITTNPGCALHLKSGDIDTGVVHPAELLAQALK